MKSLSSKFNGLTLKTAIAGFAVAAAASTLPAQASDVAYRGDVRAAAICQAVLEDNPSALKAELRKAAREQRGTRLTRASQETFLCNGVALTEFADDSGARHSLAYLQGHNAAESVAQN